MSISVDEIRNVVNPSWSGVGTIPNTIIRNLTAGSREMVYSDSISENITVLTSRSSQTTNGVIQGLLYVPDLDRDDPCVTQTAPFVPATATRQKNLPPTNYNLIAIAPWVNANCTKSYLASARTDPLRAFIFYRPGNSTAKPPPVSSSVWNLNDDGKWKTQNSFPIYAISGTVGHGIMYELSQYSGNLTAVPFGKNITNIYAANEDDYVRIWTQVSVSSPDTLPQIWVFVLITAGVLLFVVGGTSLLMHWVARRRRASLRRRVISGEVNIEGMGIRRIIVPLSHIQQFPLFTYHYEPDDRSEPVSPASPTSPRLPGTVARRDSRGASESNQAARTHAFSEKGLNSPLGVSTAATDFQPVCAICLEAYQNRVTIIRELPCGHIFHPDCIDEFLGENSSLCPVCKACMLPKGYCPRITNSMVRRERAIRRLRDSIEVEDSDVESTRGRMHSWGSSIKNRIFSPGPSDQPSSTELRRPRRTASIRNPRPGAEDSLENQPARPTDLMRDRMRQLAGSPMDHGEGNLTRLQRIQRKIFPGF
ncbi:hypothetical protein GQ53DRAFT_758496 [Thozetella sp. PMI_491]|nr:hypothetical protein GQ53DRAFT_758496 [Thozetella sp. PMI_491]